MIDHRAERVQPAADLNWISAATARRREERVDVMRIAGNRLEVMNKKAGELESTAGESCDVTTITSIRGRYLRNTVTATAGRGIALCTTTLTNAILKDTVYSEQFTKNHSLDSACDPVTRLSTIFVRF
uniref:Uncharacterized protein n=1 Tax=Cacopsylla melanoneura TaxID=428564 RepID=A0A8D8URV6_9HEMI